MDKINKDLYEYLTYFADNTTILNLLSVNKKFNNDINYKRVIIRKYPKCISQKDENETWKKFFLRLTKCTNELEEKYSIRYDKNPFLIRNEIHYLIEQLFLSGIKIDFGNENPDKLLSYIIYDNLENLFNYFIKHRNVNLDRALKELNIYVKEWRGYGTIDFYTKMIQKIKKNRLQK